MGAVGALGQREEMLISEKLPPADGITSLSLLYIMEQDFSQWVLISFELVPKKKRVIGNYITSWISNYSQSLGKSYEEVLCDGPKSNSCTQEFINFLQSVSWVSGHLLFSV